MLYESAALAAALSVALSNIISPPAIRHLGPIVFNCWRLGAALLALVVVVALRGSWSLPTTGQLFALVGSSVVGIVIGDTFIYAAMSRLGPRRTALRHSVGSAGWTVCGRRGSDRPAGDGCRCRSGNGRGDTSHGRARWSAHCLPNTRVWKPGADKQPDCHPFCRERAVGYGRGHDACAVRTLDAPGWGGVHLVLYDASRDPAVALVGSWRAAGSFGLDWRYRCSSRRLGDFQRLLRSGRTARNYCRLPDANDVRAPACERAAVISMTPPPRSFSSSTGRGRPTTALAPTPVARPGQKIAKTTPCKVE